MSSPAAKSIRVHVLDGTGSKVAQMRMRSSPMVSFGELRDLASERYLEMRGEPITLQRVQDCDGNEFYLKDQVDHLDKGEIVYMIRSPATGTAGCRSAVGEVANRIEFAEVVPDSQIEQPVEEPLDASQTVSATDLRSLQPPKPERPTISTSPKTVHKRPTLERAPDSGKPAKPVKGAARPRSRSSCAARSHSLPPLEASKAAGQIATRTGPSSGSVSRACSQPTNMLSTMPDESSNRHCCTEPRPEQPRGATSISTSTDAYMSIGRRSAKRRPQLDIYDFPVEDSDGTTRFKKVTPLGRGKKPGLFDSQPPKSDLAVRPGEPADNRDGAGELGNTGPSKASTLRSVLQPLDEGMKRYLDDNKGRQSLGRAGLDSSPSTKTGAARRIMKAREFDGRAGMEMDSPSRDNTSHMPATTTRASLPLRSGVSPVRTATTARNRTPASHHSESQAVACSGQGGDLRDRKVSAETESTPGVSQLAPHLVPSPIQSTPPSAQPPTSPPSANSIQIDLPATPSSSNSLQIDLPNSDTESDDETLDQDDQEASSAAPAESPVDTQVPRNEAAICRSQQATEPDAKTRVLELGDHVRDHQDKSEEAASTKHTVEKRVREAKAARRHERKRRKEEHQRWIEKEIALAEQFEQQAALEEAQKLAELKAQELAAADERRLARRKEKEERRRAREERRIERERARREKEASRKDTEATHKEEEHELEEAALQQEPNQELTTRLPCHSARDDTEQTNQPKEEDEKERGARREAEREAALAEALRQKVAYQDPNAGLRTPDMKPVYRHPWPRGRGGGLKRFEPAHRQEWSFFDCHGRPRLGPGPVEEEESYEVLSPNFEIPKPNFDIMIPTVVTAGATGSTRPERHTSPASRPIVPSRQASTSRWKRSFGEAFEDPEDSEDSEDPDDEDSPPAKKPSRLRTTKSNTHRQSSPSDDSESIEYWLNFARANAVDMAEQAREDRHGRQIIQSSRYRRLTTPPTDSEDELTDGVWVYDNNGDESFEDSESDSEGTALFIARIEKTRAEEAAAAKAAHAARASKTAAPLAEAAAPAAVPESQSPRGTGEFRPVHTLRPPPQPSKAKPPGILDPDEFFDEQKQLRDRSRASASQGVPQVIKSEPRSTPEVATVADSADPSQVAANPEPAATSSTQSPPPPADLPHGSEPAPATRPTGETEPVIGGNKANDDVARPLGSAAPSRATVSLKGIRHSVLERLLRNAAKRKRAKETARSGGKVEKGSKTGIRRHNRDRSPKNRAVWK